MNERIVIEPKNCHGKPGGRREDYVTLFSIDKGGRFPNRFGFGEVAVGWLFRKTP